MVSGGNDAVVECFFTSLNAVQSSFLQAAKNLEDKFPLILLSPPKFNKKIKHFSKDDDEAVERRRDPLSSASTASPPSSPSVRVPPLSILFNSSTSSSSRCLRTESETHTENVKTKKKHKHKRKKENDGHRQETCVDCCLHFAFLSWSVLSQGLVQAFPNPFKNGKKVHLQKHCTTRAADVSVKSEKMNTYEYEASQPAFPTTSTTGCLKQGANNLSVKLTLAFLFNHLLHKLDKGILHARHKLSSPPFDFDHIGIIKGILKGGQADVNCFLGNLSFARVGGAPQSMAGATSVKEDDDREEVDNSTPLVNKEEPEGNSAKKIANGLLNIPLSNVDRLRSTLSAVSLTEMIELLPQLGRPSNDYPDKKKLISVQDFFKYTESEGRRFFEELDRDGDGQVTLEDLEIAMRRRKLPQRYAREFMRRTKRNLFSKSFGWKQFLTLMEQKEPTILRAYTTLCLSKFGTLQKSQILTSLKNAGLPANEDNAVAMMRFLNADTEGSISYGHFRNFMLLLPSDRLEDDPRSIWFEAATVVAVPPPVEIPAGSVLKSALAGGLASALSTSFLYPVDTIKTRLQASTLSLPELVAKLPEIGVKGLYRGSIPAVLGQFSSHGLRTGIFEASRLVLINISPTLPEIQVQSISSFCSTFLGTAVRIPCEVLKQRLQAGMFNNVGEAIVGTYSRDGIRGFFRGTGATLCREVPFYVAGMGLYAESKKAVQHLLKRELEPWETIAVGALSGGLAAVVTTPFDVMKTRMMTAPQGVPVSMSLVAFSILRQEGPLGLFKGAVPRFFWIAPLGAMNFAGYELARKAMDKTESDDQIGQSTT